MFIKKKNEKKNVFIYIIILIKKEKAVFSFSLKKD